MRKFEFDLKNPPSNQEIMEWVRETLSKYPYLPRVCPGIVAVTKGMILYRSHIYSEVEKFERPGVLILMGLHHYAPKLENNYDPSVSPVIERTYEDGVTSLPIVSASGYTTEADIDDVCVTNTARDAIITQKYDILPLLFDRGPHNIRWSVDYE